MDILAYIPPSKKLASLLMLANTHNINKTFKTVVFLFYLFKNTLHFRYTCYYNYFTTTSNNSLAISHSTFFKIPD